MREKKEERPREYIHTRMDVHEDERGNKGKVKKIESPISAPTKNRVDTLSHWQLLNTKKGHTFHERNPKTKNQASSTAVKTQEHNE